MLLLRICTAMLRKHAATHKELKRQTGLPEKQMSNSVAMQRCLKIHRHIKKSNKTNVVLTRYSNSKYPEIISKIYNM